MTLQMNPLGWQNSLLPIVGGGAEFGLISTVKMGKLRPREEEGQDRKPSFLFPKLSPLPRCSPGPEQHVIKNCGSMRPG